jgi:murein L,D-transpeptidase YcbB/YkuD
MAGFAGRRVGAVCLAGMLLAGVGCRPKRKTTSAPKSDAYVDSLRPLVGSNRIAAMHWPDFTDFAPSVRQFYDDRNYEVAWVGDDGKPTKQAIAFIQAFGDAAKKGLNPADYDAGLWLAREGKLGGKNADDVAAFDAAMTVNAMRYLSDLHAGRVNPTHFNFEIDTASKHLDLPEFVSDKAVDAADVPSLIRSIEPDNDQYRQLEDALGGYLTQQQEASQPVPASNAPSALPPAAPVDPNLGAEIQKIDDSLERWRWLPDEYLHAPLMVNLPEFVVRGYKPDGSVDFTMKVVVGKVQGQHDTPVFTHEMKFLIFRPFWNVPMSIIKKELTPHIARSGVGYLAEKDFETVSAKGEHVNATAAEVEHGGVVVRQKPGPKNSLGLVKFMFPNPYDIYLHSTPEPQLFNRKVRDFSHGCVRVQDPAALAVWVLNRGNAAPGDWDLDKVNEAMNSGPDSHTVSLKQPIPIVLFYLTARVGDDGQVQFFDDLYGYDKALEDVLAKGRPYPMDQVKVNPNAVTTPGDTD